MRNEELILNEELGMRNEEPKTGSIAQQYIQKLFTIHYSLFTTSQGEVH